MHIHTQVCTQFSTFMLVICTMKWAFKEKLCCKSQGRFQNIGGTGALVGIKLAPMGRLKSNESFQFLLPIE